MVNQQFAFAVHTLAALAANPKQGMTSESIAQSVNTNPVVIRRLLAKLSKSALVETQMGKNGGVRLKKSPQEITLKDIYLAIQNRTLLAANENETNRKCPISCKMKSIMEEVINEAEEATLNHLETIKLSDLAKQF